MDNISKLLIEAKPLYHKRKKQRQMTYSSLCVLLIGGWLNYSAIYSSPSYNEDALNEYIISMYAEDNDKTSSVDTQDEYYTLINNILG